MLVCKSKCEKKYWFSSPPDKQGNSNRDWTETRFATVTRKSSMKQDILFTSKNSKRSISISVTHMMWINFFCLIGTQTLLLITVCGIETEKLIPKHFSVTLFFTEPVSLLCSNIHTEVFYLEFLNYLKINKTWIKRFSQLDWRDNIAGSY